MHACFEKVCFVLDSLMEGCARGSFEWSMIVTSCHDLIAIMRSWSWHQCRFLSGRCHWASVTRLAHLVWERRLNRSPCLSAAFPPLTTGSTGLECNLIADVAWPMLIDLQLQEPTNTVRPSLENDTYAVHVSHAPPPIPAGPHSPAANYCRWWTLSWHCLDSCRHPAAWYCSRTVCPSVNDRDQEFYWSPAIAGTTLR